MWIQYSELLESKDLDLQLSFVPHDNDTPTNHVTSLEAQDLLNIPSIFNQEQTSTQNIFEAPKQSQFYSLGCLYSYLTLELF